MKINKTEKVLKVYGYNTEKINFLLDFTKTFKKILKIIVNIYFNNMLIYSHTTTSKVQALKKDNC